MGDCDVVVETDKTIVIVVKRKKQNPHSLRGIVTTWFVFVVHLIVQHCTLNILMHPVVVVNYIKKNAI